MEGHVEMARAAWRRWVSFGPIRLASMRLILLALALIPVAASAQRSRPIAEKGDVALVAAISGVSFTQLTPAFGGVGVRYRVADRTVIGTSVGFQYQTLDQGEIDDELTQRSVSVALWNENHLGRGLGVVSPFLGAGTTFRAGSTRSERTGTTCDETQCPGPVVTLRQSRTDLSFGVGALLGAEVRLARGVTLGAAYTLGVEVYRSREERTGPDGSVTEYGPDTSVRAGTGTTDLHVSVYF
jgi:opacity protein-like surface antigen